MPHKQLEATAATTDLGEFTAIAAAWTVDRQREVILPGAFAATIASWRASGKRLPLHYNHKGSADQIIGYVDPNTMRETDAGLYVEGKVDIHDSDIARDAWRSMKNGAMSLSIGYLVTRQHKRDDGIRELRGIDLFEISIVPHPANADTKILGTKSVDLPPELIGTAFDPAVAEAMAQRKTRPIRVVSFDA